MPVVIVRRARNLERPLPGAFTRAVVLPVDTMRVEARLHAGDGLLARASQDLHVSPGMEGQQAPVRLRPVEPGDGD